VALLDTACGFGCMLSYPVGAVGFTTIELKTNFLGTAREGRVSCEARLTHGGRTTQVWDAEAKAGETMKTIALFRCTQMILYPKP
jgi:1,4-dihydroxy-2-naphthoyl-CoA hydrolase